MAIPKQVKVGGSYYKGTSLSVDSASGNYVIFIAATGTGGSAFNSLSIIPGAAGAGDTMLVEHRATNSGTGGAIIATLAESLPNMGAGIPLNLDFFAMEKMAAGEALKVTYTNTASIAMTVFIVSERGR